MLVMINCQDHSYLVQSWHRRVGHLGCDNLRKLATGNMVEGMKLDSSPSPSGEQDICEPCFLSKNHKKPLSHFASSTTQPLALVHMNVCGPIGWPYPLHAYSTALHGTRGSSPQ
jgi:hypothetical protein